MTLGLVLLYYCFSIGITFYNKWLTKVTGRPAPRGREGGGGAPVPFILNNRRAQASASHVSDGAEPHSQHCHARDSPEIFASRGN